MTAYGVLLIFAVFLVYAGKLSYTGARRRRLRIAAIRQALLRQKTMLARSHSDTDRRRSAIGR